MSFHHSARTTRSPQRWKEKFRASSAWPSPSSCGRGPRAGICHHSIWPDPVAHPGLPGGCLKHGCLRCSELTQGYNRGHGTKTRESHAMRVQTSQATGTHSIPSPLPPQPPRSLIFFFNLKRAHSFPLVPGGMILVLFPNTTHAYCGELLWPPPSGKRTTPLFSGSEPCLSCVSRGTQGSKGPAEPRTLDILCSHYNLITTCTWSGPRQMLSLACPAHLVPIRPPPQVPAVSLKDWHYHVPNPY